MPDLDKYSVLGELSAAEFLAGYWQKKPLLVRQAIPGYSTPVSPDELAGLACMDDVESRIVLEKDGASPWQLQHGPFDEDAFGDLPSTHWTLLVQECNKHVPQLALLLDQFNFIPNWRVDDVMVSYAAPQGSVGPHVDQYDVFLLQGLGKRRWQINTGKNAHLNFLPGAGLRILKQFESEQEWILEPGDMLYLPPGVAHYGVALDDCMTLSVGFRAPGHDELLTHFGEDQFAGISDPFLIPRYEDPRLILTENCGEISDDALRNIVTILQSYTGNIENVKRWFGRYITEPKADSDFEPQAIAANATQLRNMISAQEYICRSEYVRFSYIQNADQSVYLYVNGNEYLLRNSEQSFAKTICSQRRIDAALMSAFLDNTASRQLVLDFFNNGYLYFEEE
ncbi:MAG: cupin domain-containing protein [Gammaproteobacteria bacterium]|nr:cupin domain-containing protein [Gammaproteobacteria bacterium]